MESRIGKLLVLLGIGACANVAVAWLIVMFVPANSRIEKTNLPSATTGSLLAHTSYEGLSDPADVSTPISGDRNVGVDAMVWGFRPKSILTDFAIVDSKGRNVSPRSLVGIGIGRIRAGWPFRSMTGSIVSSVFKWTSVPIEYQYAIPLPKQLQPRDGFGFDFGGRRPLPLMPLWHGFLVNSLFYAGSLWVIGPGVRAVKQRARRRSALCTSCGYPIGSSPICTECGSSL